MKMIAAVVAASALAAGLTFTPTTGFAHKIYPLQGNQWAIICDDGTGYSFSGSAGGAQEVAGLLCAGGFTVSPTGGGPVKDVVTVTRGEMHPADKFLVKAANGGWALRPGAVPPRASNNAGSTGRAAADYYLKIDTIDETRHGGPPPPTPAGGAGASKITGDCTGSGNPPVGDIAIDELGIPSEKKDKKGKGVTMTSNSSSGASSNAAGRTGDCTVKPGRPGTRK